MANALAICHLILGLSSVWIVGLRGNFHWWLRRARVGGLQDPELVRGFLGSLDQMHLLGLVLGASSAASAFLLWRRQVLPTKLGIPVFIFCALAAAISAFSIF